ncbi:hypothetical protein KR018_011882 [Drosophila ironensis]|nr:hypothetical protein KR018_011882 [Drosophila ironensis]
MLYPLELPRPRRPIYASYGARRDANRPKPSFKDACFKEKFSLLLAYLKEYTVISSMHGIRYLTEPKLKPFERIIWLLILVATTIGAIVVYVDLNNLYQTIRIQTTIQNTMLPIFRVPFPSIGLCPRNRMNWVVLENEAPYHFLGPNVSEAQKDLFIRFFQAASDPHLSRLEEMSKFFKNASLTADLHLLNDLDLMEVFRYLQFKCEHLFSACRWRGNPVNCCDIFELQFTESGLCFVFNSNISPASRKRAMEDKFYPLRTPQFGEGSGLDIFLRLNRSYIQRGKRGVYLMIKQPQQWSDVVRLVPHETQTQVTISPRLTSTDDRARAVPPEMRRCIFADEVHHPAYKNLPGFEYWMGNCRSKCHQEHVLKLCHCSPSIFFPVTDKGKGIQFNFNSNEYLKIFLDNFTICKASDFKCLYDHRLTFNIETHPDEKNFVDNPHRESMVCDCYTSCRQLIFDRDFSTTALDNNETDTAAGTMRIDVSYQSAWLVQYHTTMRFTFLYAAASFGGIIGLFLGASLLSGFELVYYFTIGLFMYLRGERKLDESSTKIQAQTPIINIQLGPRKITPIKYIS